jgi:CheY-like chemotaxis protein
MRILVVDDSEDARDLAEGTLLSGGYDDVVSAASGWEAFKVLDIGRNTDDPPVVDIVLLDVVMPEMDGVEVCARIRNDQRYADLPIIMVTSVDDMDTLSNAFVAGANDYVTKPVNRMELIARVRAALRLKAELDRRQARERELLGFLSLRPWRQCRQRPPVPGGARGAPAGGDHRHHRGVLPQRHDHPGGAGIQRQFGARARRDAAQHDLAAAPAEFRIDRVRLRDGERRGRDRTGQEQHRAGAPAHPGDRQGARRRRRRRQSGSGAVGLTVARRPRA